MQVPVRQPSYRSRHCRDQQPNDLRSLKPGPHQQQCRSNVRLCRKDKILTQNSFDIVAIFGNKVERCFDIVAGVDGALHDVFDVSNPICYIWQHFHGHNAYTKQ